MLGQDSQNFLSLFLFVVKKSHVQIQPKLSLGLWASLQKTSISRGLQQVSVESNQIQCELFAVSIAQNIQTDGQDRRHLNQTKLEYCE